MYLASLTSVYYWFQNKFEYTYTKRILLESIDLLGQLWPYLLLGIVLTSVVKLFVSKHWLAKTFNEKRDFLSIPLASFLGVLSPLGSYVIIPLSAALLTAGVPLPILMALMISSPIINPSLFFLTAGAMGIEMAIMRVVAAFVLGIVAGYITRWAIKKQWVMPHDVLLADGKYTLAKMESNERVTIHLFLNDLYLTARWIGRYFFLAIVIAAAIKIFTNPQYIIRYFSDNAFLSVIISTGAGVPFYVCGGAAIPIVQQLSDLGLSNGAALAFFISGPATKISNLIMVQGTFRRNILLIYLITGIGGALLFGVLYNLFG